MNEQQTGRPPRRTALASAAATTCRASTPSTWPSSTPSPQLRDDDTTRYPGEPMEITIRTDEFSPVCPWSGLPDFGELVIRYLPRDTCVELKSLKYYLTSYRFVGIYHEHATKRVLGDLVRLLDPLSMHVTCDYGMRGGIRTVVTVNYVAPDHTPTTRTS